MTEVTHMGLSLEQQVSKYGKEQVIALLNRKLENIELGYNTAYGDNYMGRATMSNKFCKEDILFSINFVNNLLD